MNECSFCSEINNLEENNFYLLKLKPLLNIPNRILFSTQNWLVIPTIGAFVPGYLLIVTREHYISISSCPSSFFIELENLVNALREILSKKYNSSVIAFEHGAASIEKPGGCCVNHTHLHILPGEDVFEELKKLFTIKKLNSFSEIKQFFSSNQPYIFYQDHNCQNFIAENDIIPSQFMRQIIAQKLKIIDKWDWRKNTEVNNIRQTIFDVSYKEIESVYKKFRNGCV